MNDTFRKLLTPWKAEDCFDDYDAFCQFLLTRNKRLNVIRVVFFAIAAILLLVGYAVADAKFYNYGAVICLLVSLGLTLIISQNEKQLPKELREK